MNGYVMKERSRRLQDVKAGNISKIVPMQPTQLLKTRSRAFGRSLPPDRQTGAEKREIRCKEAEGFALVTEANEQIRDYFLELVSRPDGSHFLHDKHVMALIDAKDAVALNEAMTNFIQSLPPEFLMEITIQSLFPTEYAEYTESELSKIPLPDDFEEMKERSIEEIFARTTRNGAEGVLNSLTDQLIRVIRDGQDLEAGKRLIDAGAELKKALSSIIGLKTVEIHVSERKPFDILFGEEKGQFIYELWEHAQRITKH